jgi:hypothetical protein|tara:strand:- start:90 stop:425 length:336 start_codon:yes stop_codon:yes gene_type:complete
MFRSKIILSTIVFLIFLIITSIVKNQTRIIEKSSYKLSKKISLKEKDINESQLDFYFLTSPAELEKKINILGLDNYSPIENSKIFLSFNIFTNLQKKISAFDKYDKKKKKN